MWYVGVGSVICTIIMFVIVAYKRQIITFACLNNNYEGSAAMHRVKGKIRFINRVFVTPSIKIFIKNGIS